METLETDCTIENLSRSHLVNLVGKKVIKIKFIIEAIMLSIKQYIILQQGIKI